MISARRAPRRASRLVIGALLGAAVLLGLSVPSPASAHAGLTASDPASGATVSADLDRVTLTFTEAPLTGLQAGLRVEVRDASGTDESTGQVVVSGTTMSKAVTLSAGPHAVLWRYVSPDGHPIDGRVDFTVTAASAGSSATPEPSSPPAAGSSSPAAAGSSLPPTAGSSSSTSGVPGAVPWVLGGIVVLLLGAGAAAVVVRRRRRA